MRPAIQIVNLLIPFLLILAGCDSQSPRAESSSNPASKKPVLSTPEIIERASLAVEQGRFQDALQSLKVILAENPNHPEALFLAARCQAGLGDLATAVKTLEAVPAEHPQASLAALGQSADWLIALNKYDEAERKLIQLIQKQSKFPVARRRLAQLLNNQGRRIEAAPHLRALAELGDVTEDELYGMNCFCEPFVHRTLDEVTDSSRIKNQPLSDARLQWYQGDLRKAREIVEPSFKSNPHSTSIAGFVGRLYAELPDDQAFVAWSQRLPQNVEREPEYWYAIGIWYQRRDQHPAAIRCFLEAVSRDDTDRFSYLALARSLAVSDRIEESKTVMHRFNLLDQVNYIVTGIERKTEDYIKLERLLSELHRNEEANAWSRIKNIASNSTDPKRSLSNPPVESVTEQTANPVHHFRLVRNEAWARCGLKLEEWPLPELAIARESLEPIASVQPDTQVTPIQFHNVSSQVGIDFRYQSNRTGQSEELLLHESTGGGIAVCDIDLDGWSDLYFTQGGGEFPTSMVSLPNQLYRNLRGESFTNITEHSMTGDLGFAQGASAADINQDGFIDLIVANIGINVLYYNNGDGTFRRSELAPNLEGANAWTTSILCGDLDGDHLPEIVEVNYIDDPQAYKALCIGNTPTPLCSPQRYRPATNRFLHNRGDGEFDLLTTCEPRQVPSYGFGGIIANFDRRAGNDVFIANDTDLNHYWVSYRPESDDARRGYILKEQAQWFGCALGVIGLPRSCMGVANGDFDRNGLIDLHITNFTDETSDLYLQQPSGLFQNRFAQYGLDLLTMSQMGWGTQAFDIDHDGWLDLAILNGNIYNHLPDNKPYRMLPQLMRGGPNKFVLVEADGEADAYWKTPALGRTLATMDWNRDGRMDLVAGHLDQPVALLQNDTSGGNWVQFELTGTVSEREAIGAEVIVRCGTQSWTSWLVGGNGYLCRCEPILHFGVADVSLIDEVEVRWPSGQVERRHGLKSNERYRWIEGQ